ncbi:hypothetical protein QPK60_13470 [Aeromonas caviae]|uniref:hypothetical protein n=1 Tax=Aeromonas caviae TaxID=648 RepID=UPI002540D0DF|nr:hypothetical protein [Aeromonas caviae]MDK3165141.1 hypothetical protein [Aeromonas caviae]
MQNITTSIIYVFLLLNPVKSISMEIYRCEVNGVTIFSDIKCASNAKIINSTTKKKQEEYSGHFERNGSDDSIHDHPSYDSKADSTIYTGPRGGKFYYNKNGNKTYIEHK